MCRQFKATTVVVKHRNGRKQYWEKLEDPEGYVVYRLKGMLEEIHWRQHLEKWKIVQESEPYDACR